MGQLSRNACECGRLKDRRAKTCRPCEKSGRSFDALFWRNVEDQGSECWIWQGATTSSGYGRFQYAGKQVGAHRAAYELMVGPIPEGMCLCHTCDVRACVNPAHLFLGTKKDNHEDSRRKGRHSHGLRHGMAKLTPEGVDRLRELVSQGLSYRVAGERFGVSATTVMRAIRGTTWRAA